MLQRSATTSNTPVNTFIPEYNYSPLNSPDAPQYHNMNRQQHSTIHNMNYDLNKQGSTHNYSVGHEGRRTPYFGPSQPWQPVQHMPGLAWPEVGCSSTFMSHTIVMRTPLFI